MVVFIDQRHKMQSQERAYQYYQDTPRRDPPPYPGHHYTQLYQPGYRQSYSGSETSTDLSLSSTENLSTSARQDPQGEETAPCIAPSPLDPGEGDVGGLGLLSQLGMPATAVEVKASTAGTFYVTGSRPPSGSPELGGAISPLPTTTAHFVSISPVGSLSECIVFPTGCNTYSPSIYTTSPLSTHTSTPQNLMATYSQGIIRSPPPHPAHQHITVIDQRYQQMEPPAVASVVASPQQQGATDGSEYPPPPQYPGVTNFLANRNCDKKDLRRSYEMLDRQQITRSQPDLTRLADPQGQVVTTSGSTERHQTQQQQQQQQQPSNNNNNNKQSPITKKLELDHAAIATRATQMVERLSDDNRSLRHELQSYYKRVSKLQKFELEIQKVSEAYESLVKHSQKRETLEKIMRFKMDAEMKKTKNTNKELKDQLDKALLQLQQKDVYNLSDSDLKKELGKKDSMMSKLISQNKEVTAAKERLDIEVAAQRSTLQEQRAHIEVLDNALTNSQTNIIKLEMEVRKKQLQDERIMELQTAVSQLQKAAEKREEIERRLRSRLEDQVKSLRSQNPGIGKRLDSDEGIASDSESPTSVLGLVQQMEDKEQHILELEAQVLKWEQKYLEENALRQLAVDAASMPKDARIAALEQSSTETEKIIADARSERLKHLEEVYQANRRAAELEAKNKTLQAQLAERDAMINVLQRHSSLSRTSSISSLFSSSPLHSPHLSFMSSTPPLSISSPPSGASSRQNSHLDSSISYCSREALMSSHSKSSSTGTSPSVNTRSSCTPSKEAQFRELTQKLAAQAALFRNLQLESDQLTKQLWQV